MGTNEGRNQLLNEIITVRDYRDTERERGGLKEMKPRHDGYDRNKERDGLTLNLYRQTVVRGSGYP